MAKKILMMDPDGLVRESMALFLENLGYEVNTSSTAKDALQSLSKDEYEVVICARYMPDMDGLDFLRRIRKIYPNMLKVLESDFNNSMEFFDEARLAGVNEIIHKPFTATDIQQVVSRLDQKYRHLKALRKMTPMKTTQTKKGLQKF